MAANRVTVAQQTGDSWQAIIRWKLTARLNVTNPTELMRIVLFGTGPFAVPAFVELFDSAHEVAALVTRPITNSGKRRKTAENPTRDFGESRGLDVLDPVDVNTTDSVQQLRALEADLFVVCDYGQILSNEALAAARLGGINLHGSLLPKYRGAAPIHWAIYNGDTTTGVTIIHMTAKLDGGPCLTKAELEIGPLETTEQLEPRLAELGVGCVMTAVEMLERWDQQSPIGTVQDRHAATKAPRLKRSDGQIDFSRSATDIVNQIRAFQPWPGTFTSWTPEGKNPLRLIIHQAQAIDQPTVTTGAAEPGEVVMVDKENLVIQTGSGQLSLITVQPAGKKPMEIADYLRGNPPTVGSKMGAPS